MIYLNKMLSLPSAIERYGAIDLATRQWLDMAKWMTLVEIPKGEFPGFTIMDTGIPVTHISCNRDIATPLRLAFDQIVNMELQSKMVTYDGCFNIRAVRGEAAISTHSYGLGIDFNAKTNPLGGPGDMDMGIVKCFCDQGFDWGGDFRTRKDPMHFSYGWE